MDNLERSTTTTTNTEDEHIPCGYSMSTIWTLDDIENKNEVYRGEDCMKTFCECLREHRQIDR